MKAATEKLTQHKDWIDPRALEIINDLQSQSHTTYLVGGCIRDLLLNIKPKDFDIATMAKPQEVKKAVPRSYIIGKRFKLVLAKRGQEMFEIATFRKDVNTGPARTNQQEASDNLDDDVAAPIWDDNTFGSPEEDAQRRDFTVNGLFYDPFKEDLIDYVGGLQDLRQRTIRMIGDPLDRLVEDPIRILRAIRLAHKIKFPIEEKLLSSIQQTSESLVQTALPRRREEYLKFLRVDDPSLPFLQSFDLGILKYTLPSLHNLLSYNDLADVFIHKLKHLYRIPVNTENPLELFSHLTLAYIRTNIEPNPMKFLSFNELKNHDDLNLFMKNELGMFNQEQDSFLRALQTYKQLANYQEILRRGERRQIAFLQHDSFPLALCLARREGVLSDAAWTFWLDLYQQNFKKILEPKPSYSKKRPPHKKSRR